MRVDLGTTLTVTVTVFITSYAITEAQATDPDWGGHKWYWEKTDYRYGSMNGFSGLTQSEVYAALDSARAELTQASDYDVGRVNHGGDWITKTYWSDTRKYGHQTPQIGHGYITGSDVELNYNSAIT